MSVFKTIYSVFNFIREYHVSLFRGVLTFADNTLVYLFVITIQPIHDGGSKI